MSENKQEQETVDFAYAIDCTGSMRSYIQQVRSDIDKVVSQMAQQFPAFKLRLGCVAYRDWCDGGNRLQSQNFTESVSSFKNYVGNLKADGGGDEPEDVLGGLNLAAGLSWNSKLRVLFHICDAPPHNTMYHDLGRSRDDHPDGHSSDPNNYHAVVLDKFKSKNIHLCIAKLNDSVTKMINVFKDYSKKIELTMEERSVSDASQLLNAVKQTLEILTKVRHEIKETQTAMKNITNTLSTLSLENEAFIEESMNKMEQMDKDITDINTKMNEVDTTLTDTKREYDELKSAHSVLIAYARNATKPDEIEKAECDVMELNVNLTQINEKYSEAQDKLNETLKDLAEKNKDLGTTDTALKDKSAEKSKMKSNIANLKSKLDGMDVSEEREAMRNDIKSKLKDISKLFNDDAKIKKKIMEIRRDILKAFKEAKNKSKHINDCKRDVNSRLGDLDTLLEELEDRE